MGLANLTKKFLLYDYVIDESPFVAVGPIFFAAQLLANLIVFWIVLGLEAFSREMQIGTYVIVVAVILLIVNGPGTQDYEEEGTTFQDLITQPYAMIWAIILVSAMLLTGIILAFVDLHQRTAFVKYAVLLTARATAFALNLSTGKALVMDNSTLWLTVNLVIKIVSGMIYTGAIVVQSTAVKQRVFVPVNAATIVLINGLTGIIIWEDWRVVQSWIGYACVFLLLALGCGLLLGDLGLLQETSPETFMGARVTMVYKENRQEMVDRLKNFGKADWEQGVNMSFDPEDDESHSASMFMQPTHHVMTPPSLPLFQNQGTRNRRSKSTSDMMPGPGHCYSDALPLKQSAPPQLPERRCSTQQEQARAHHRAAWMSVYEGAGATSRQNSVRWRHSILSANDIQPLQLQQSIDDEIVNTSQLLNGIESNAQSISESISEQPTSNEQVNNVESKAKSISESVSEQPTSNNTTGNQ